MWCNGPVVASRSNSSLADGRRLMYLLGMPFLCVGSCGVAMSTSLQNLLFWRFVQTFGCSGGISLGAGVIGDIYKLEERGSAIGVFFGVSDS
jgi:MFS family permease